MAQLLVFYGADPTTPAENPRESPADLARAEDQHAMVAFFKAIEHLSTLEVAASCRLHAEARYLLRRGRMDPDDLSVTTANRISNAIRLSRPQIKVGKGKAKGGEMEAWKVGAGTNSRVSGNGGGGAAADADADVPDDADADVNIVDGEIVAAAAAVIVNAGGGGGAAAAAAAAADVPADAADADANGGDEENVAAAGAAAAAAIANPGGAVAAADKAVKLWSLPFCKATAKLVADATRGWHRSTQWLHHFQVRMAVFTVLVAADRLQKQDAGVPADQSEPTVAAKEENGPSHRVTRATVAKTAETAPLPILPPEMWTEIMQFFLRSWWTVDKAE